MPKFDGNHAPIDTASPRAQSFFTWLTAEVAQERAPNIDGQHLYAENLAANAARGFLADQDFERFRSYLEFLTAHYPDARYGWYGWQSDALMLQDKWSEAWELRAKRSVNRVRTFGQHLGSVRLTPLDVFFLADSRGFTKWGLHHLDDALDAVGELADNAHDEAGVNFVDELCDGLAPNLGTFDFTATELLIEELDSGVDTGILEYLLRRPESQQSPGPTGSSDIRPFRGFPSTNYVEYLRSEDLVELPRLGLVGVTLFEDTAAQWRARQLVRQGENLARERGGLPAIGGGWVAETQLFETVRRAFPHLRVQKHARPNWLAPQHFDVYLPQHNIAIEYQGAQHFKPVSVFGGEEGFAGTVERDARKRRAAEDFGCLLIEVAEGHDVDALLAQIEEHIKLNV